MSEEQQGPGKDAVREQMKAALDRKNAAERRGEAHLDGHGKGEHPHDKTGGPEQFRRKSG
jgi:hypothetical protein